MTVRWWTAVVAAASMLAVHNCEVKSENAVAEEHNGMQQMELVDMLMYNKECGTFQGLFLFFFPSRCVHVLLRYIENKHWK